jgi:hypothetical protein
VENFQMEFPLENLNLKRIFSIDKAVDEDYEYLRFVEYLNSSGICESVARQMEYLQITRKSSHQKLSTTTTQSQTQGKISENRLRLFRDQLKKYQRHKSFENDSKFPEEIFNFNSAKAICKKGKLTHDKTT